MYVMHYLTALMISVMMCYTAVSVAQGLPRHLTEEEEAEMPQYLSEAKARFLDSDPPQGEHIRSIAEWEELKGIAISWVHYYRDILKEIVRHAKDEGTVYIHCEDEDSLRDYLISEGIDTGGGVEFIESDYNTIWIRDYGPNSVYLHGADSLVFIDWIYNRPRPQDDMIPLVLGNHMNVPVVSTNQAPNDLVHTGGNYFTDGEGMAFSSKLVLEENGPGNNWGMSNHELEDIERIMRDYMGVDEYVFFDNLPFDIIHHIDMHMKLIDEETLLVGEYPDGVADAPQIEANIQYLLSNFETVYGREFELVRIPMPPDENDHFPDMNGDYRTYTNAIIINGTVLVPTYEERYDTTALRIWSELLPGHEIIGINSNRIIPQAGAIHCITKEIGVKKPIWIRHKKLRTEDVMGKERVTLRTNVQSYFQIEGVSLRYATDDSEFETKQMQAVSGDSIWSFELSIPRDGDSLYYYFTADATSGKTVHHPLTGSEGAIRLALPEMTSHGAGQALEISSLKVYPNPASAITCIEFDSGGDPSVHDIVLFNSMGTEVMRWRKTEALGMQRYFFDAGQLPGGIYFLQFRSKDDLVTRRIVVQD